MSETKNVFVTIVGRPNVGKSSLLNALVGEKIAAVSAKPQTTRTRITGVLTQDETQYVFIDTPGKHKAKNKLGEHMMKTVQETVQESEVALLMCDCTKPVSDAERELAAAFRRRAHLVLVVNKTDLIEKEKLLERLAEYSQIAEFEEVIPVSVLNADGLDLIMEYLAKRAEVGPHYFPDDKFTDQPEKVLMAEMIREKALNCLNDEVPHGIAVTIEQLEERDTSKGEPILDIRATIYCERDSHKGIVIGKGGAMLRRIGSEARTELENFFEIKVNLDLWVKVKEGWRNKEALIKNFGLS
ncbi:GTP-binding protein Era [Ruminococcus sp. YE71]|uniref:GTPase Era n=1 Tax=unclassified Ruminococcus TaxID=2608920 RepID=UPI00088F4EC3|nr:MULTISPECIES: GTPase Era [unclassified Ruminococcus]SDA18820.1 GTP-binding protein Era [Ruminococcus sp. YE78]SFW29267.1 GTP-binding protein Era [Ruminococcus sp. YE71]